MITVETESRNLALIEELVDKEWTKNSHYITSDLEEARKQIQAVSKEFARIKFDAMCLELTPSNAIKFILTFNKNMMLMVTSPFDKIEELDEDGVVFSLFEDRELVVSDAQKLNVLVDGVISLLQV